MPSRWKAKDVMTRHLVTIAPEAPLPEAIRLLMRHRISGLPVVDPEGRLVGMITEKDLLHVLGEDPGRYRLVRDLMTRELRTFQAEASLDDVVDCLLTHSCRRVPILEGERLVGLISRADLMETILEVVQERLAGEG